MVNKNVSEKNQNDSKNIKKSSKKSSKKIEVKLFNKWDCNIEVKDPGLKKYITLKPKIIPRSAGIHQKHRFHKSKMNIVERLALHIMVPGHSGKKHTLTSGHCSGKFTKALSIVEKAFNIIEKKENKNPVEVFIRALENAALREEVTSYQIGSVIVRSAVVTAPQRRIDKTLRYFAQGAYKKSFNSKISIEEALASEILGAYKGEESFALKEKERIEREAAGAR